MSTSLLDAFDSSSFYDSDSESSHHATGPYDRPLSLSSIATSSLFISPHSMPTSAEDERSHIEAHRAYALNQLTSPNTSPANTTVPNGIDIAHLMNLTPFVIRHHREPAVDEGRLEVGPFVGTAWVRQAQVMQSPVSASSSVIGMGHNAPDFRSKSAANSFKFKLRRLISQLKKKLSSPLSL